MLPVGQWTGGDDESDFLEQVLIFFICSAGQQLETGHVEVDLKDK